MTDTRVAALADWAGAQIDGSLGELSPVAGDASFRRYFRATTDTGTVILMDAPPAHEDSARFADLARAFAELGVRVPTILARNDAQGFVMLEDFGDALMLASLNDDSAELLYAGAMDELFTLQSRGYALKDSVPPYDRDLLERELGIFTEWLVQRRLRLQTSEAEKAMIGRVYGLLVESALEQPQVLVHRDYHSRNLLVIDPDEPDAPPGVIDFQDAVYGPITYDLVSLLRDCYIGWPEHDVGRWAAEYFDQLSEAGLLSVSTDIDRFMRWFDLMGMQRHLKAAGIFCRLHERDGRDGYLKDIPRTLRYVANVAAEYDDLAEFGAWVGKRVLPWFEEDAA